MLNQEQTRFFNQVARLAFLNPFSPERERLESEILGQNLPPLSAVMRKTLLLEQIERQLDMLATTQTFDIRRYRGQEKDILGVVWLVKQFYRYQQDFIDHIARQQLAGEKTLTLPFADKLIGDFESIGYDRNETARAIALLFQLHRAYGFIDEAVTGMNTAMVELRQRLWNNIFTFNPEWYLKYLCGRMEDFSLLLLGETGTGKSRMARAIGRAGFIPFDLDSRRFKESFTTTFRAINLSQYSAGLLESELFGHKKGAFTGAVEHHQGILAECSQYGSVFIDEIGEIDTQIQVKLLNVLQDRVYCPVGSREIRRFEGRIISATNRPIDSLLASGAFRADFYYRLCSDVITVPNLRERIGQNPGELRALIATLLSSVVTDPEDTLIERIEHRIEKCLPKNYLWPGNVRELEQCIRRICLTGEYYGQPQTKSEGGNGLLFPTDADGNPPTAQGLLKSYCRHLYDQHASYEAVARITHLDRRTVKKNIDSEGSKS